MAYVYVKAECEVPLPSNPAVSVTLHAGKRFDAADQLVAANPDKFAEKTKPKKKAVAR